MRFADSGFRSSSFMRLNVLAVLRQQGLLTETLDWVRPAEARETSGALCAAPNLA
jgi:hypothetical protein